MGLISKLVDIWLNKPILEKEEDYIPIPWKEDEKKEEKKVLTPMEVVQKSKRGEGPICPYCHEHAEIVTSEEFYGKDYGTCVWKCTKCKDVYVGTMEGTDLPLGVLADEETRSYRKRLYQLRTELNAGKWMSKEQFNERIGTLLKMESNGVSFVGYLSKEQCVLLIQKTERFLYKKKYEPIFNNYRN